MMETDSGESNSDLDLDPNWKRKRTVLRTSKTSKKRKGKQEQATEESKQRNLKKQKKWSLAKEYQPQADQNLAYSYNQNTKTIIIEIINCTNSVNDTSTQDKVQDPIDSFVQLLKQTSEYPSAQPLQLIFTSTETPLTDETVDRLLTVLATDLPWQGSLENPAAKLVLCSQIKPTVLQYLITKLPMNMSIELLKEWGITEAHILAIRNGLHQRDRNCPIVLEFSLETASNRKTEILLNILSQAPPQSRFSLNDIGNEHANAFKGLKEKFRCNQYPSGIELTLKASKWVDYLAESFFAVIGSLSSNNCAPMGWKVIADYNSNDLDFLLSSAFSKENLLTLRYLPYATQLVVKDITEEGINVILQNLPNAASAQNNDLQCSSAIHLIDCSISREAMPKLIQAFTDKKMFMQGLPLAIKVKNSHRMTRGYEKNRDRLEQLGRENLKKALVRCDRAEQLLLLLMQLVWVIERAGAFKKPDNNLQARFRELPSPVLKLIVSELLEQFSWVLKDYSTLYDFTVAITVRALQSLLMSSETLKNKPETKPIHAAFSKSKLLGAYLNSRSVISSLFSPKTLLQLINNCSLTEGNDSRLSEVPQKHSKALVQFLAEHEKIKLLQNKIENIEELCKKIKVDVEAAVELVEKLPKYLKTELFLTPAVIRPKKLKEISELGKQIQDILMHLTRIKDRKKDVDKYEAEIEACLNIECMDTKNIDALLDKIKWVAIYIQLKPRGYISAAWKSDPDPAKRACFEYLEKTRPSSTKIQLIELRRSIELVFEDIVKEIEGESVTKTTPLLGYLRKFLKQAIEVNEVNKETTKADKVSEPSFKFATNPAILFFSTEETSSIVGKKTIEIGDLNSALNKNTDQNPGLG